MIKYKTNNLTTFVESLFTYIFAYSFEHKI